MVLRCSIAAYTPAYNIFGYLTVVTLLYVTSTVFGDTLIISHN